MPIQIKCSSPVYFLEHEAIRDLIASAASNVAPDRMIVTPTIGWSRALDQFALELTADDCAMAGLPIQGWDRVVTNLANLAIADMQLISPDNRHLLTMSLMRASASRHEEPWRSALTFPGHAEGLMRLFDECVGLLPEAKRAPKSKLGRHSASELMKRAMTSKIPVVLKDLDQGRLIWDMFTRYSRELIQRGLMDGVWREWLVAALAHEASWSAVYPSVKHVTMLGFDELRPLQKRLLEQLARIGLQIEIIVDVAPSSQRWRNPGQAIVEWGRTLAEGTELPLSDNASEHPPRFLAISSALFQDGFQINHDSPRIIMAAFLNRQHEVEGVARLIKQRMSRKRGQKPILIACGKLSAYAAEFKETLERHGLRCQISGGQPLTTLPAVKALLGLLSWALNDFSADHLRAVLSYSYIKIKDDNGDPISVSDVERLSTMCRVKQGREEWNSKIASVLQSKKTRLTEAKAGQWFPEDRHQTKDDYVISLQNDIDFLEVKSATVVCLMNQLTELIAAQSASAFVHNCRAIVHEYMMPLAVDYSIQALSIDVGMASQYRHLGAQLSGLEAILDLIAAFEFIHTDKDTPITGQDMLLWLRRLAEVESVYPGGELNRARPDVIVTTLDGARGIDCEIMFVCGMVEGEVPGMDKRNPLTPSFERRRLMPSDSSPSRRDRQIAHFRRILTQISHECIATYPLEDEGEACIPSSFLMEAQRLGYIERLDETPHDTRTSPQPTCPEDAWVYLGMQPHFAWRVTGREWRYLAEEIKQEWERSIGAVGRAFRGEEIEHARIKPQPPGQWEGVLGEDANLVQYIREAYSGHIFSPTELESIGLCGMRHYFEKILALTEKESFEDDITPLEKGLALHHTLQRFFEGKINSPHFNPHFGVRLNPENMDQDLATLRSIASSFLESLPYSGVAWEAWRRQFLGDERIDNEQAIEGTLRAFLRFETEKMTRCHPRYLEAAFGRMGRASGKTGSISFLGGGCHLDLENGNVIEYRGRIDRVDWVDDDGVAIWDYKSGGGKTIKEIREGFLLQAALYAFALEKGLHELGTETEARDIECSGYYVIKGDSVEIPTACIGTRPVKRAQNRNNLSIEEARALTTFHLQRIMDNLTRGVFAHTRDENFSPCGWCSFNQICRKVYRKHKHYAAIQGYENPPDMS